jgi:macrodomain Ter protein organizer (MatP/YcbG family)
MEAYQTKAISIYLNFFMKDKVSDFENRIIKAKSQAISYVQKEIELKSNNPDDLFYWSNIKNSLEKI